MIHAASTQTLVDRGITVQKPPLVSIEEPPLAAYQTPNDHDDVTVGEPPLARVPINQG